MRRRSCGTSRRTWSGFSEDFAGIGTSGILLLLFRSMKPGPEEFETRYARMSEVELLELAQEYDSLTETAQSALRAEFARRHLEPPLIDEPVEEADPAARELVTVRRYRDLSEAIVARSLLESAGIAAGIRDENIARMEWQYSNLLGGISSAGRRGGCRRRHRGSESADSRGNSFR
jgi:hypothetical protein